MTHEFIKTTFSDAVNHVASNISLYTLDPDRDLTRNSKFNTSKLISFMVSCGSSGTKLELPDFFGLDSNVPSSSAFNQQRAKLKPDALEAVFHYFNFSVRDQKKTSDYRFFAADGSSFTFFSRPSFCSPEYFVSAGHSAKGFFSVHLNAFYDLQRHTYSDALIQPVHQKDEFRAFCDMVDRHRVFPGTKDVFIGDRGYCSYNNMAHVPEKIRISCFVQKTFFQRDLLKISNSLIQILLIFR